MARLIDRPIVVTVKDNQPHTFTDRDYTHTIAHIVDFWQESGAWWLDEPSRYVFTVLTMDSFLYDIERVGDKWFIYRVWD